MTDCVEGPNGTCQSCGWKFPRSGIRRTCQSPPPITIRVAAYACAVTKWIAAGRPTRSQERIDAILAANCEPCEHFSGTACKLCGCRINKSPEAWRNKLAMATEACPLDPPKWEAETG